MEVKGADRNKGYVLLYEAMGTATLILAVNMGSGYFTPIAVGMALYSSITYLGSVSGGHFNPAVTTAVATRLGTENLAGNLIFAAMMIAAQIVGGSLGCLIVFLGSKKDSTN